MTLFYKSLAKKLGFDISDKPDELSKFTQTVNECGIDINHDTFRQFVAVTMPDGEKQILCLKETKGQDYFSLISEDKEIAATLPISNASNIFNSVRAQNFASIQEQNGIQAILDRKPNQCLVFVGGELYNGEFYRTLLSQVSYNNAGRRECVQFDFHGSDASIHNMRIWLKKGAELGKWENPSSHYLQEHKELEVSFIELDKVVRIAKDEDNYISVPQISMFPDITDSLAIPQNPLFSERDRLLKL